MDTILITIVVLLLLYGIAWLLGANRREKDKQARNERAERIRQQQEENARREKALKEDRLKRYDNEYEDLVEKMGGAKPDRAIIFGLTISKEIWVYDTLKKVIIQKKVYDFSDILSCSCKDYERVEKGDTKITSTSTTKTDNGNMIGRAIIGGVIAGEAGAIIGGATAKKQTETNSVVEQEDDITHHEYVVSISVKDTVNPLIKLFLGENESSATEIVALMNAIINA